MSEYLFILGAGASQECGGPLMSNFFEKAREIYGRSDRPREAFDRVMQAISKLQVVHSKAYLDLYNLESVFGALEMGRMLGGLPGFAATDDIKQTILALREVIATTLEESIQFKVSGGKLMPPTPYDSFARFIKR